MVTCCASIGRLPGDGAQFDGSNSGSAPHFIGAMSFLLDRMRTATEWNGHGAISRSKALPGRARPLRLAALYRNIRAVDDPAQDKARMHAGHAGNARDAVEQQFLKGVHVGHDDLELVVGLLPGDQ